MKLGYPPLVSAPVSLKTISLPNVNLGTLTLSDGPDTTPIFYNEESLPELRETDPYRSQFESNLVETTHNSSSLILGTGRGM